MANQKQGGVNPVVAAVTGAVVGASIGVAGAVALHDKKNRKKVEKVLSNVKDTAVGYMEDMQKKAEDQKSELEGKLAEGKKKTRKVVSAAKKAARAK